MHSQTHQNTFRAREVEKKSKNPNDKHRLEQETKPHRLINGIRDGKVYKTGSLTEWGRGCWRPDLGFTF